MKKALFFLSSIFAFSAIIAQTDTLYMINNLSTDQGVRQITGVNPNTGAGAGTPVAYATGDATTVSAAMALANNGYLYYISQADESNGGAFTMRSIATYPTAITTSAPSSQVAFSDDINGPANNNDVTFRSMAAAPDGWVYMTVSEQGNIHLAKFLPGANGTAGSFTMLGTITLDGNSPASSTFRNGDIAFDGIGNLYAVINEDVSNGNAVIYYAPAGAISTTNSGTTNLQTKYQVKNHNGSNFSQYVVGLAIASSGNFYIAVQGWQEGGIYLLSRNTNGDFIISENPISNVTRNSIADLATNYFPTSTVLPVIYGPISAKIVDGSLIVNWSTLLEINNTRFEIEVSEDGKHFTNIGTVDTKALNGNSDKTISYSFTKTVNMPVAAMGISLFSLAIVLLLVNRKNRMLFSIMMVMGIGLAFASCSKNGEQVDVSGKGKLFVRIIQVDQDGARYATNPITAYTAD